MARKILLADDSVTAQNMGRKILADAGYEVITVNNGSAALKRISEQRPDVIVLDVYMPGYSGLEVCQRLKEVGETSGIPILLTVGKLEPFKPEEVKRVRADAFIVKPFEASELLSALSKLEDRIVPRAQESKPGRFARAAMDQVPYDKTMAIEEDTTWKNRIQFPSKKKAKEPEPDEPVETQSSKDLQSVIEKRIAETPATSAQNERVDLGALAPAGLPKDVTPEEIAALAAAAAQMQGRIADGRYVPPTGAVEPPKVEVKEEPKPVEPPKVEAVAAAAAAEAIAETKPVEKVETKEAEAPAPASFADQVFSEQPEKPAINPSADSGNGSWPAAKADEPVTMAVASVAEPNGHTSRWTAVAVALAPEEAAISLDQEMQKAYAAFAAAEDGHAKSEPAAVSPAPAPVETSEPIAAVPAIAAPEVVQPLAVMASAATEAMTAAAEKLEAVASSVVEKDESQAKSEAPEPSAVGAPAEASEPAPIAVAPVVEPAKLEPAKLEELPVVKPEEQIAAEKSEEHAVVAEAKAAPEESSVVAKEVEKAESHETDLATATAWAALQKLQGSGNGAEAIAASDSKPADTAAKAVAVGAESHPEEVTPSDSDSDSVASIVDSVLADLRPKIVAEISKKLGKKK